MNEENVLSTEQTTPETTETNDDHDEIISLLKSIDKKLTKEEVTEEITEELTEEPTEELTEETTEDLTTESIVYIDETADTHSYLSTEVENASMNDLFTVGLSIRNVMLLFFLVWVGLKLFSLLKSIIYRIMNR